MSDEKIPPTEKIERPREVPIRTPGAGFYTPGKEVPEELVKAGKTPAVQSSTGKQMRTPPGVGVNPPPPGDDEVYTN